MAKVIEATDKRLIWTNMDLRAMVSIALYGLLVGVITYALYILLDKYVFTAILCSETAAVGRCENVTSFSGSMALLLGSMLGLILLIRERVYRPLLALLGIVVALWGLFSLIAGLPWLLGLLIVVIAFGVGYSLFSWLVQPASLSAGIAAVLIVAVLIRLVLAA